MSGAQGRVTLVAGIAFGPVPSAGAAAPAVAAESLLRGAADDEVPVLVEVEPVRRRPPTLVAAAPAKLVERRIRSLDQEAAVAARGRLCTVGIGTGDDAAVRATAVVAEAVRTGPVAVVAPPARYRAVAEAIGPMLGTIMLLSPEEPSTADRALIEVVRAEAREIADVVEFGGRPPGRLTSKRLLAGSLPRRGEADRKPDRVIGTGWRERLRARLAGEGGQAAPLVLGAVFVLVTGAVVLAAIAGAITGKGRAQVAADLAALSAAGSMKADLPRLLAPPTLPNGLPNPAHLPKSLYLSRARLTAVRIATSNGASPLTVSVRFPDAVTYAPVTARVSVRTAVRGEGPSDPVWAEARVAAPVSYGEVPAVASGGGYSGPLVERLGHGMRPDVASAFDQMSEEAAASGVTLVINSAYRSDSEQAALFAANPDPTWVARPGTSLHRCGTELDLGPSSAYGWLAANAGRFGFVRRYSWEPWHFGFTAGPAPCSGAANRIGAAADPSQGLSAALPGFVPSRFRRPILAAATKWGVSAALLSAQLLAESNFDPSAVSSAGARGIAQFMPGTAAAYGLRDPFDPVRAIHAQAHLMKDLLAQFGGRPALALAAYNAGPGAVSSCGCIPGYPETQAYVARILATLGGAGAIAPLPMEVELVR